MKKMYYLSFRARGVIREARAGDISCGSALPLAVRIISGSGEVAFSYVEDNTSSTSFTAGSGE